MRNRLRSWLGIDRQQIAVNSASIKLLEERHSLAWERIVAIEQQHSDISKKLAALDVVLQEVRQLREMLADPKRQPIATRTTHQFRSLMEMD